MTDGIAATAGAAAPAEGEGRSLKLRANFGLIVGGAIICTMVVLAIVAPLITTHSPVAADAENALAPPSTEHWLGTDALGFDIFARVIYATRVDLLVAVIATAISLCIGVPLGAWLGYYSDERSRRGFVSRQVMRAVDVAQAFPVFVLALALAAALGRGPTSIVYALLFVQIPIYLRLTRSVAQPMRAQPFIDAAKVAGNRDLSVVGRHVLPNCLAPAAVLTSILIGNGILITAGLSFVGAGIQAPTPEWGYMVASGAEQMVTGQWWPALFPGICIVMAVLGFALVADALRLRLEGRQS